LPQIAPAEIRDAVTVIIDDYRAEADVPGVNEPDEAAYERADATIQAFENRTC
jgi:hypothetical protein